MGTTSQKLTYLNETKQLLKQKINNLGGSIDDNTTFRNYANQLQGVYDNLPKTEYGEGTEINLGKTIKGKLDYDNGVVGIGQIEQDGTPTPDNEVPIEYVRGKNIFDGELELGTYYSSDGSKINSDSLYRSVNKISVKPNTTYTFSINSISQKYCLYFYNNQGQYISSDTSLTTGTFTTIANCYYITFRCFNADFTSDFANLKIQLEERKCSNLIPTI